MTDTHPALPAIPPGFECPPAASPYSTAVAPSPCSVVTRSTLAAAITSPHTAAGTSPSDIAAIAIVAPSPMAAIAGAPPMLPNDVTLCFDKGEVNPASDADDVEFLASSVDDDGVVCANPVDGEADDESADGDEVSVGYVDHDGNKDLADRETYGQDSNGDAANNFDCEARLCSVPKGCTAASYTQAANAP